jgi:hypothetical protein
VFFPDLPPIPTSLPPGQKDLELTDSLPLAQRTFPRDTDTYSTRTINGKSVEVYEYTVNKIDLKDERITITPGNRVVFYVKGDIKGAIEHNCAMESSCKSGNLQIYADNTSGSICLRGNQRLEAFIFAPDYSLGKTDDGIFIGAAWGKNWGQIPTCASNSGAVAVTQGVEWTDLIADLRPPFPQLGGVDNWCEEPIDTAPGASECD